MKIRSEGALDGEARRCLHRIVRFSPCDGFRAVEVYERYMRQSS